MNNEKSKSGGNLKRLTLLHSNDMHGDFLSERIDEDLVGGVSMLSGYVSKVRHEEENVLYAIAGDMFRGSIIDSEYHGLSTIQIMNMLSPDIVTLGNHEVDYGVAHLLFLEKCAEFPIINANLYIKTNHSRLFEPCRVIEIGGMKVLFIGILTEAVLAQCKMDKMIGTFITLEDAADEIGRICNTYNAIDVDLTVLLTHIGIEEDQKLAEMLDPAWGVDVIIGGHSHTFLDEPVMVNGIPIVQAGTGTDQIGRFDIVVNTDTNSIDSFEWKSVPINSKTCPMDNSIKDMILNYKNITDEKYGRIITKFVRELTHPERNQETEIGNLFADIMKDAIGTDLFFMGSGSIRSKKMGPVVTKGDFDACFPYDDPAYLTYWTGAQLKHGLLWMLRDETFSGDHTEFYQISRGFKIEYDQKTHSFLKFEYEGMEVPDDKIFTVGLQEYHLKNLPDSFDLSEAEINENHPMRAVATSCAQILEEMLQKGQHQDAEVEDRIRIHHIKKGGDNEES
ncbi:MAG: bifunctional metallophosphatase/5'-nucleotidase [Lachnospiraceae bacterium]|jgi:5'-nucleotidase|nr:bifunctional metallophosphatase/5'-nucleotidase [Lachnospiraceae bacterium]